MKTTEKLAYQALESEASDDLTKGEKLMFIQGFLQGFKSGEELIIQKMKKILNTAEMDDNMNT